LQFDSIALTAQLPIGVKFHRNDSRVMRPMLKQPAILLL